MRSLRFLSVGSSRRRDGPPGFRFGRKPLSRRLPAAHRPPDTVSHATTGKATLALLIREARREWGRVRLAELRPRWRARLVELRAARERPNEGNTAWQREAERLAGPAA